MEVAGWLRAIGMSEYIAAFSDHRIGLHQLTELTDADLKEIGVKAVGDRRALLKAAATLSASPSGTGARDSEYTHSASERRHLTILFLDLVGSTALAADTDPEVLSQTIGEFHRVAGSQIRLFEGHVAQSFGDGLMAYFGWPTAHEDDPQRAVLAAEAAHMQLRDLQDPRGRPLLARAGVATGWIVLGDIGGTAKEEVVGETPNLAARIQGVAEPGHTVVSAGTAALLGDGFQLIDMGPQVLKGFEKQPHAFGVKAVNQQARYQSQTTLGVTPLIGRDPEMTVLRDLWAKANKGQGQLITLTGEAGIGKTRVVRELVDEINPAPHILMRYHCSPYYQNSALRPMIMQLSEAAGFRGADDNQVRLEKLRALLSATGALDKDIALIAELLGIEAAGAFASLPIPAVEKRQRIFAALADQFTRLAQKAPILAVVEDAHWLDPTTAEYMKLIARSISEASVLLVVTGRPEYRSPSEWETLPHANYFTMRALSDLETERLAENVAVATLPRVVLQDIVAKTDGVPLYIEEFTKGLIESSVLRSINGQYELSAPLANSAIPASLQDSLTARLDKLPNAKSIAQIAAALGREFNAEHLCRVVSVPEHAVWVALEQLEAAGVVFRRRATVAATHYLFKHALVQNAAYESLLLSKRRALHSHIAETLMQHFTTLCTSEPEVVASHWARSNNPEKSARLWLVAGQSSLKRSAYVEADSHLRQCAKFLKRNNDSEAIQLEFELSLCTGQASYVVNGPAAAETIQAYSRALELLDNIGGVEQRFDVLYGIFSGYHFASKFDLAREPAEKTLQLATQIGSPAHICQAHRMLGYLSFFEADLKQALHHFQALSELYEPDRDSKIAIRYGADSLVAARGFEAVVHGVQGRVSAARDLADQNLAYARSLNHPPSVGWALASGGYLNFFLSDPMETLRFVREGVQYCDENNVAVWGLHCRIFQAWAEIELGSHEPSKLIAEIRNVIANVRPRISLGVPLFRSILASLLSKTGKCEESITEIAGALSDLTSTGQRFFSPAVFHARAQCFGRTNIVDVREVLESYRRSADDAFRMGAAMLELRAYTMLAKLDGSTQSTSAIARLYPLIESRFDISELRVARQILNRKKPD